MYNRKKQLEPVPEENTKVWICETEGCNSWMREDYTFAAEPACAICSGTMSIGEKMLPTLSNTTG
ncbi:cold-shock protein [Paenibacillus yanchengensis]|uniref:Cold-shock protein n=1 Tax=Paenibacillus yanchengensis TaxID=2035833 RepID=A0ABW4YPJ1_9BACL